MEESLFNSRDALMLMSYREFMMEAINTSQTLKAALVRAGGSAVIGDVLDGRVFTANFKDSANLRFAESHYLPYGQLIVGVAEQRKITAVPRLLGAQVLYALEQGSLTRWTFNEISGILNASARPSAVILSFRRPAQDLRPV